MPVVPDDIANQYPVASLHAIVVHGGTRPLEEVEAWVHRTLESLLPKEGQSSEHVVGRETHAWTPHGFPRPVRASGIFLKSDRDSRNALIFGGDLRTKLRDAFCKEHPGGSLILLSRAAYTSTDVANLSLCHRDPKAPERGTWVDEPMSSKYLPPPVDGGRGWGSSWTKPEVLEAVLDVFVARRVQSHWAPLLAPAREEQLSSALKEGRSSSVSRTRL